MKKIAIFAFNGDPLCFVHVLLNGLDLREKGHDVALVIEGSATRLIHTFAAPPEEDADSQMLHRLYEEVKDRGLIDCVCRACSSKMGVVKDVEQQGLSFGSEMKGHPSVSRYVDDGYEILIF
jgi:hypothetical protein